MSDERLRQLERRWLETGTVQDETAFLLERVRVGDLAPNRLELAAHCGLPAARLALNLTVATLGRDVQGWLSGLRTHEKVVLVLAAVCLAKEGQPDFERIYPGDGAYENAVRAACAWVQCPCDRHRSEAEAAATAAAEGPLAKSGPISPAAAAARTAAVSDSDALVLASGLGNEAAQSLARALAEVGAQVRVTEGHGFGVNLHSLEPAKTREAVEVLARALSINRAAAQYRFKRRSSLTEALSARYNPRWLPAAAANLAQWALGRSNPCCRGWSEDPQS